LYSKRTFCDRKIFTNVLLEGESKGVALLERIVDAERDNESGGGAWA
jgi:hypothetical protein